MSARCIVPLLLAVVLSPAVVIADVYDDARTCLANDQWTSTLEQSFTDEEVVASLGGYGAGGCVRGGQGYSLFNGYAQVVGARYEARARLKEDGVKDPWYTAPFTWLKDNAALVPDLVDRLRSTLRVEHVLFANYLLAAHDTITSQPGWQKKFEEIRRLYAEYAPLEADPDVDWEVKSNWATEHQFETTIGSFMWHDLTPEEQSRCASVMPDYVAWGLAKDWIGSRAYPSVISSYVDKTILCYSSVSFENYLASFWYRRWADGSLDAVYAALKLVSAAMPRDFARQAALGYGFADTIAVDLTRAGADWERHPTPSAVATFVLVGEDGKTPIVPACTAAVPVAQPAAMCAPDVDGYSFADWETLTPAREGETATVVLAMKKNGGDTGVATANTSQPAYGDYTPGSDIFGEDFSANGYGWYTGVQENCHIYSLQEGYYELKSVCSGQYTTICFNTSSGFTIDTSRDFEIEASLLYVAGEDNGANSISWGRDVDNNRFRFGFSGNGQYLISKVEDGTFVAIKPWTVSGLVKPHEYNRLTIRKIGRQYLFYLNGDLVHSCPFEPFFGPQLDFTANENTTVRVDAVRVSYLVAAGR